MAKKNAHKSEEIMLIPFLDILCSLIGVLALIIVVLVVAQTQRIKGRTPEELQRAQEHLKLLKLKQEYEIKYAGLAEKLEMLKRLEEEHKIKKEESDKLKNLLTNADSIKEKNKAASNSMQVELDRLMTEIRGLAGQEPDLKKKVAELLAAFEKIKPPEKKDPAVRINPAGSGMGGGTVVFFIDAAGDKLTFFWNPKEKYTVSSVPEVIVADGPFNAFLQAVKAIPQSKLIFLLRDDGMRSYNLGAGWAQSQYGFKVEQMGKMLVPGRGDLDLQLFGKLLGTLPDPPPPRTAPPASPTPAPPAPPPPNPAAPKPPAPMPAPGKPVPTPAANAPAPPASPSPAAPATPAPPKK